MAISTTPKALVYITPVEGKYSGNQYKAQFNPKELQVDKTVSWTPKDAVTDDPTMEFKEPQSRQLTCTLYFDSFEQGGTTYDDVAKFENLAKLDDTIKHPPLCIFTWGTFNFKGVISALSSKHTMFSSEGKSLRCEVALTMQSASKATVSAPSKPSSS